MENDGARGQDTDMGAVHLQVAQLKAGLVGAVQDLSTLNQRSSVLEERMTGFQNDTEEKILDLTSALDTVKEHLSATLCQIAEVSGQQVALQRSLELFQAEVGRHLLTCQQRKRRTSTDFSPDRQRRFLREIEHSVAPRHHHTLPNGSSRQSPNSDQDVGCRQLGLSVCPVWVEQEDGVDGQSSQDGSERQTAALQLLESERVYVSYLSLLLKANITFNDSEGVHLKDKRPFPSSLRFLIQQHLELLHTLQERVLRCQWQGMMGDVFLRLTSKESDFLDLYVAYLKELPDCLSAARSYKETGFFQDDVTGNETQPPLHTLLLQPAQRIPEYLTLLQNLLRQTDPKHPDYFLLLVSLEQFRVFSRQHGHLPLDDEALLLDDRRELQRQHQMKVKRSKQRLLEQIQCKRLQDREPRNNPATPFVPADPRHRPPALHRIPKRRLPGHALADARDKLLLPPPAQAPGPERLHDDGDCSSASTSDSSVEVAILRRPKSRGGAVRGCVSPDPLAMARHRPLWSAQRKSKSLNGLQLDLPEDFPTDRNTHGHQRGAPPHAGLERQSSRGSTGRKNPEDEELARDHHKGAPSPLAPSSQTPISNLPPTSCGDCGPESWVEESRWRQGSEDGGPSFTDRSRTRDQKGGFRSSFRKLFKKKSGGGVKDRANESQAPSESQESAKSPPLPLLSDIDRGTAV